MQVRRNPDLVRFLYKIHSGYDGFRPAVLPKRMKTSTLQLRWDRYIDVVEKGWECWVYFHGPHKFENGVYAKGTVKAINYLTGEVNLRVQTYSDKHPITSRKESDSIAEIVSPRYRQVFLWPDDWHIEPQCSLKACKDRQCGNCSTWTKLLLIEDGESSPPSRLRWSNYEDLIPAHWVVPSRCYWRPNQIKSEVDTLSRRFYDFKAGELGHSFPFALSIYTQLRRRNQLEFDYVVPIPLSPHKAEKREVHRTKALAIELSKLLGIRQLDMLSLSQNVSKREMQMRGKTVSQFENQYREALQVKIPADTRRILLVDDVMTRGSTIAQALSAIAEQKPQTAVIVATVGQMIVKEAVLAAQGFLA